jgi:hypothetical protein
MQRTAREAEEKKATKIGKETVSLVIAEEGKSKFLVYLKDTFT